MTMPPPPYAVVLDTVPLEAVALDPAQVVSGAPEVRELELWRARDGAVATGVWEITPGVVTDVEADEVFVVLDGRATVEIDSGATLELSPGVAGAFRAGSRTTWHVHETLRKLYTVQLG